jgi:hypothetical protein
MPWCVLRGENLHACHPQVREVLQQALEEQARKKRGWKEQRRFPKVASLVRLVVEVRLRSLWVAGLVVS